MSMTVRQARQRVGRELGIIYSGTTSSATTTSIVDTNAASPLDPGDVAERLNGAGVLVYFGGAVFWRQNVTYTPSTQTISWTGAIAGLTGTVPYEVHIEPVLNPLINWPDIMEDALRVIKRLSFQEILLVSSRSYYDLTDYKEIIGPEQVRRLYEMGPNLLKNASFETWALPGTAAPLNWTMPAGTVVQSYSFKNYRAANMTTGTTFRQAVPLSGPRRIRATVFAQRGGVGSPAMQLILTSYQGGDGATLVSTTTAQDNTTAVGTPLRLTNELEVPREADTVRIDLVANGGSGFFWAPTLYDMSQGRARRIQPATTFLYDDTVRLYVPSHEAVGRMALLLPYTLPVDDNSAVISTSLSDRLLVAAVAVQVLRWLMNLPTLPDKSQYAVQIATWTGLFHNRHREHMRRIAKTQQLWEAGELA